MNIDIKTYLWIFIVWLIRTSYQLECIRCTSPIRRLSHSWDHSCLEGTLTPLPCQQIGNRTESYQQCLTALYRVGPRGRAGVLIQRDCTAIPAIQHECSQPVTILDLDKAEDFYCIRTCFDNGCNRHSVYDILSNSNILYKNNFLLLLFLISLTILII